MLAIDTGLFGHGIGEMASSIGADVAYVSFAANQAANDLQRIADAIAKHQPKLITVIHCETPSGIINPIADIGALKAAAKVPLYFVDAISSCGGMDVNVDANHIDICFGVGQKALSAFADMSFLSISDTAWRLITDINYQGYDSLLPFRHAVANQRFPYTPHWQGVAALQKASDIILEEGLQNTFDRHIQVAALCRELLAEMDLSLFPEDHATSSPTVTAVNMPSHIEWSTLDKALRKQGMVVGKNFGELAGKVFRIGHMGVQADVELIKEGMRVLKNTVAEKTLVV